MAKKSNKPNVSSQSGSSRKKSSRQPSWNLMRPEEQRAIVKKLLSEVKKREAEVAEMKKELTKFQKEKELARKALEKEKRTAQKAPLNKGIRKVPNWSVTDISMSSTRSDEHSKVAAGFRGFFRYQRNTHETLETIDPNRTTVEDTVYSTASTESSRILAEETINSESSRSRGLQINTSRSVVEETINSESSRINTYRILAEETINSESSRSRRLQMNTSRSVVEETILSTASESSIPRGPTVESSKSIIEETFLTTTSGLSCSTSSDVSNSGPKIPNRGRSSVNVVNLKKYKLGPSTWQESHDSQSSSGISRVSQRSAVERSSREVSAHSISEINDSSAYSCSITRHEPDSTWALPSTLSDFSSYNETRLEMVELHGPPQPTTRELRSKPVVENALRAMNDQLYVSAESQPDLPVSSSKVTIQKKKPQAKTKTPYFLISELVESQTKSKSRSASESSSGSDSSSTSSEATSSGVNADVSAYDSGSKSTKEDCFEETNLRLNYEWKKQHGSLSQSNFSYSYGESSSSDSGRSKKKGKKHVSKSSHGSLESSMDNLVSGTSKSSIIYDTTGSGSEIILGSSTSSLGSIPTPYYDASSLCMNQTQFKNLKKIKEDQEKLQAEIQQKLEDCQLAPSTSSKATKLPEQLSQITLPKIVEVPFNGDSDDDDDEEKEDALKSIEEKKTRPIGPQRKKLPIALKRLANNCYTSASNKPRLSNSLHSGEQLSQITVPEIQLSSDEEEAEDKENCPPGTQPNKLDYVNRSRGKLSLPIQEESPELVVKKSLTHRFTYSKRTPGVVKKLL